MPSGLRPARLGRRIPELHHLAEEAGRPPIPVTAFNIPVDVGPDIVASYVTAEVVRAIFWLPVAGAEEVLSAIDRLAQLAAGWA